jgi:hypothetical protein
MRSLAEEAKNLAVWGKRCHVIEALVVFVLLDAKNSCLKF